MLLAIDIGNTNTVFAIYEGDDLRQSWRLHTEARRSCDEYASFLHEVLRINDLGWGDISAVIVGSVVPDADLHVKRFCSKYLSAEPLFVTKDIVDIGITIDRPEDVGADRLINALAVKKLYPQVQNQPVIVIDFGTATTFDVIDCDMNYAGGVIAPGIHLSVEALERAAAKLPRVEITKPDRVIGHSTVGAIQSGIFWGYISMIEGMVARLNEELGAQPFVLATGGLAGLFAGSTDVIEVVDGDLTLKGLLEIYKRA